jgi:hypothetical protein
MQWIGLRSNKVVIRYADMFILDCREFTNGLRFGYCLKAAQTN